MLNFDFINSDPDPGAPPQPAEGGAIERQTGDFQAPENIQSDTPQFFGGDGDVQTQPTETPDERVDRALDEMEKTLAPVKPYAPAEVVPKRNG